MRWICGTRKSIVTEFRSRNIWWYWAYAPILAVYHLAKKWVRCAANMMAGSAPAMVRTMIHRAEFVKGRRQQIWKYRPIHFLSDDVIKIG